MHRRLAAFLRSLHAHAIPMTVSDHDGNRIYSNAAYNSLVGYAPQDLLGQPAIEIVAPPYRTLAAERIAAAQQTKTTSPQSALLALELTAKGAAGVPVIVHTAQLRSADGSYLGNLVICSSASPKKLQDDAANYLHRVARELVGSPLISLPPPPLALHGPSRTPLKRIAPEEGAEARALLDRVNSAISTLAGELTLEELRELTHWVEEMAADILSVPFERNS